MSESKSLSVFYIRLFIVSINLFHFGLICFRLIFASILFFVFWFFFLSSSMPHSCFAIFICRLFVIFLGLLNFWSSPRRNVWSIDCKNVSKYKHQILETNSFKVWIFLIKLQWNKANLKKNTYYSWRIS